MEWKPAKEARSESTAEKGSRVKQSVLLTEKEEMKSTEEARIRRQICPNACGLLVPHSIKEIQEILPGPLGEKCRPSLLESSGVHRNQEHAA